MFLIKKNPSVLYARSQRNWHMAQMNLYHSMVRHRNYMSKTTPIQT